MLHRARLLAAAIETTPGTFESLDATDAVFNPFNVVVNQNIAMTQQESPAAFGMNRSVKGAYQGTISFSHLLRWDGTATEPAWADVFLPACGYVKSGQVFTPRTEAPGTNVKTLSMAVYQQSGASGIRWALCGAMGTFTLSGPAGQAGVINFTFTGVWRPVIDTATLSPTLPTGETEMRYASSVTQWNSVDLCLENITFDAGNTVQGIECGAGEGFSYFMVTNRIPMVTGNPTTRLVASQDRYGKLLDMSEHALTWDFTGPGNGKMTIAAPKAQIVNINPGDRNGQTIDEIEWQCNRNGSNIDQEASITFTAAT